MHDPSPDKDEALFLETLYRKIKEDTDNPSFNTLHLKEVMFPGPFNWTVVNAWKSGSIAKSIIFEKAIFLGDVDLSRAHFQGRADFTNAQFSKGVNFSHARFDNMANFNSAKFSGNADFCHTRFDDTASFEHTIFPGEVDFSQAQFSREANFNSTRVMGEANFIRAKFSGAADFIDTHFFKETRFTHARFSGTTYFSGSQFLGVTHFYLSNFLGMTDFSGSQFLGVTHFYLSNFLGMTDFSGTRFSESVGFLETNFSQERDTHFENTPFRERLRFRRTQFPKDDGPGKLIFRDVVMERPEEVFFEHVDLSRASFLRTNVSRIHFVDVKWPKKVGRFWNIPIWPIRNREYAVVFDHFDLETPKPKERSTDKDILPILVGQLYRQLRLNLEADRQEVEAGAFYTGQMDMRRKDKNFRREYRSLLLIYRFISMYGESYVRPLVLYFILGSLLAVAYRMLGTISYADGLFSALTAGALFRNVPDGVEGWEKLLVYFNMLADILLLGLTLVALRRAFRR